MDIYKRLEQDHQRQRDLAAQVVETEGDSEERRRLFDALRTEAESHANAEEQVFYAALLEEPEAQEQARHSISEHQEAHEALEQLSTTDMSSPQWLKEFKDLKKDLEHHMEEEEDEVFELARSVLSAETAKRMTERFEQRKANEEP